MGEKKLQKNFVDQVKGKKKITKKSIGVYKYLVHHSFFEVIVNAYPLFYTIIQDNKLEKEFDKSIFKFMQKKAISPYIWKMPNEYRKFLKESKYFKKLDYLNDLLYFEYSELFIFMQKKIVQKKSKFKISKNYILSPNVSLHKYNYNILEKIYDKKEECYIMGYYDIEQKEIVYRNVNTLLFELLKTLDSNVSLHVNLRLFLKRNKIPYKLYGKEFISVLEELYKQEVIIR